MADTSDERSKVVPVLVAALVCDTAALDPSSGKKSLIGIFDRLTARQFPTQRPMALYFKVADAEGKYDVAIRFLFAKNSRLLAEARGEFRSPNRLVSIDQFIPFPPLAFPEPGRYEFHIFTNEVFIGAAFLDAIPQPPL